MNRLTPLSNIHTHTTYCDGTSTPAEMAEYAYQLGYKTLGFSGHSYTAFDTSWCMSVKGTVDYVQEISRLKAEYAGRMNILLGIERDYFSDVSHIPTNIDFTIGSVHYISVDMPGVTLCDRKTNTPIYIPIDESPDILLDATNKYFHGDIYSLIERYYELVADVVKKTGADVVGHFDLVTKFNDEQAPRFDQNKLFDEENPRYKKAALNALHEVLKCGVPIEINFGAVNRGFRTTPYPSLFILDEIDRQGGAVILTGDFHSTDDLSAGMKGAQTLSSKYKSLHFKLY